MICQHQIDTHLQSLPLQDGTSSAALLLMLFAVDVLTAVMTG